MPAESLSGVERVGADRSKPSHPPEQEDMKVRDTAMDTPVGGTSHGLSQVGSGIVSGRPPQKSF